MASAASEHGLLQLVGEAASKLMDGIWKEGAKAVEQVRHEIVDRGWFGRHPQQEQQEAVPGSVYGPAKQSADDPMGRTGRDDIWSEDNFFSFKEALDRHQDAGVDTHELENAWTWGRDAGQIPDAFEKTLAREITRDDMER